MKNRNSIYYALSVTLLGMTFGFIAVLPSPQDSVLLTVNRPVVHVTLRKPPRVPLAAPTYRTAEPAIETAGDSESEARVLLERILAMKGLIAATDSVDAAFNGGLHESIFDNIRAKDYAAASFLIQEALRTGQGWAYAYAAELAGNKNVFCSRIAVSALFQDDSPLARQTLDALKDRTMALAIPKPLSKEELRRDTEDLPPLEALNLIEARERAAMTLPNPDPRDLLNIAASTNSAFATQLFKEAFAAASPEQKVEWFIQGAWFRSGLVDGDPRMAVIWESLVAPDVEMVRTAALATMFEARHLQYPGGRDSTSRMVYDVMTLGGYDAQIAVLDALQAQIEGWSLETRHFPSGNLPAMQLALDVALTSADDDVRRTAEDILANLEQSVNREAISEAIENDFRMLPVTVSTLR